MNYLYAFLFTGFFCALGQIILDNTKFTPGHITSSFTVLGSFMSFFGIYDFFSINCGAGANVVITNFGNALYQGGITGYKQMGFIGIFSGLLQNSSAIIVSTIVFAFILSIFFKPRG
ncbi:MAG: SpoVA/SpoVAEb family sporulation membrane protein [bacterium]